MGNVESIYNNSFTKVAWYTYDAYGNYKADGAPVILAFNHFTYRGYYYDEDLGLYYLQTRYYDPTTARFINADNAIPSTKKSLQGFNLFSYCFNNPVSMKDSTGNWPRWITAAVAVVAAGVAVVATLSAAPAAAIIAAGVAVVSTVAYVAQSHHYDKRAAKNVDLPLTRDEAFLAGWLLSDDPDNPDNPAAACHQYTSPDRSNVKAVSPDGRREVIYNSKGKIVTDPRDIGTYNFCPSGTFWGNIGHFFVDMVPWLIFGNNDDDPGPLINEVVRLFE